MFYSIKLESQTILLFNNLLVTFILIITFIIIRFCKFSNLKFQKFSKKNILLSFLKENFVSDRALKVKNVIEKKRRLYLINYHLCTLYLILCSFLQIAHL